jgi:HD-GYP domain-containing protein (c-di-GMP phosphodiesterase class II)
MASVSRYRWFAEAIVGLVLAIAALSLFGLYQQSRYVAALEADVIEREKNQQALRRVNRALRTLGRCNEVVVHATSETQLLDDMCRGIVDAGGYRAAWIGKAERDEARTVRFVAYAGEATERLAPGLVVCWNDGPAGRGTVGQAIRTGEVQISQDIAADPRMATWARLGEEHGVASAAALPLKDGSGVFAILLIHASEPNAFDADEQKLLQQLADDLSHGIIALRTRSQNAVLEQRWRASLEATVGAIANTLELRDPYTAGHQQRVATLAVAMARAMGLPEHEIQGLYFASTVHDVGKINIPVEILSKSAELSETELALLREHVEAGYNILKGIDFPWPIAEMVRQHHERLDGSGYPRGLRGGEILVGAKVLAVADVVEAMMSRRPYRSARGVEAALAEIGTGKGRLFDPAAVDACIALLRDKGFRLAMMGQSPGVDEVPALAERYASARSITPPQISAMAAM